MVAAGSCDIGVASPTHQADGCVADGGHNLGGSIATSDLGAILIEGDISYPMYAILNLPVFGELSRTVTPPESEQLGGIHPLW